jgi:hypothetical protein
MLGKGSVELAIQSQQSVDRRLVHSRFLGSPEQYSCNYPRVIALIAIGPRKGIGAVIW